MEESDLLIQNLRQHVHTNWHAWHTRLDLSLLLDLDWAVCLALNGTCKLDVLGRELSVASLVQHDLCKDLVGEGAGHDERAVTGGTTQVDQTTLCKENDVAAVWHEETVDLRLDADDFLGRLLQPRNVDLDVEVTNVADNCVLTHDFEVLTSDDVAASSGGNENLRDRSSVLHGDDLVASHGCLKCVDRINLSDEHTSSHGVQSLRTTLANVTESSDDSNLASNHDIGGTLDAIDERLSAAVQVVKLALGNGVVDVDGWCKKAIALALVLEHLVQVVNTSGSLLRDTVAALEHLWVLGVHESSEITTVVENQVERLARWESLQLLLQAPLVLLLGLALPCEHWGATGGNGGSGVVLGGEDVARGPGQLCTECLERLNEDGSLDGCARSVSSSRSYLLSVSCPSSPATNALWIPTAWGSRRGREMGWNGGRHTHVQATGDASALEGLLSGVLLAGLDKARHFLLGQLNLASAKGREVDVCNLELRCWFTHLCGIVTG